MVSVPGFAGASDYPGSGWKILAFSANEEVRVGLVAHYSGPGALFMTSYLADGTEFGPSATQTEATGGRADVAIAGRSAEFILWDDIPEMVPSLGWVSSTGLGTIYPPGDYLVILGAAGEIESWEFRVTRPNLEPSPVRPTELDSGTDVHWRSAPTAGVAHARVAGIYNAADVRIAQSLTIHAEQTLVGFFDGWAAAPDYGSTLMTPHGTMSCPCATGRLTGSDADGPGEYVLEMTQAHVRFNQPPIAMWVDAPLAAYVQTSG